MTDWLAAALDYVPRWIDYQLQHGDQPGCSIAITQSGKLVLEEAFGVANLATGEVLTQRHRFRVASHSKTFTAVGILLLKDRGLVRLDDSVGQFIEGLHPDVAAATVRQVLSNSAGLSRDGGDASYFSGARPFLTAAQLREALALPPPLPATTRFKYSNHGFSLLGLIIEQVTGEPYRDWIMREVVVPAGLGETFADIDITPEGPMALGHSTRVPFGRRLTVPGDFATADMAGATGFVSTAADLARFFAHLSPRSGGSLLAAETRRDMGRPHWPDRNAALQRAYGLGTISGTLRGWDWFGHSGSFAGTLSRTAVFPEQDIAISVLTNAIDGPAQGLVDGIARILQVFAERGAPTPEVADWAGRWWTLWGAVDLLPVGNRVLAAAPALPQPFAEFSEVEVTGLDAGTIREAPGFSSPGEAVTRTRDAEGMVSEIWLGGVGLMDELRFVETALQRYGA